MRYSVVLLAILAATAPAVAQHLPMASPESVGMSSARFDRLDAVMQRYIDDDLVAGTVTLVARQGKVVHLQAQGHRYLEGGERMSSDAIFVIMSMTKPIVSTALMMLFEEGYFLLDDPISRFIPEFAAKEVLIEGDGEGGAKRVPAARPITFRHVESAHQVDVTVGSLDDPDAVTPVDHTWVSSQVTWLRMDDGLPRHRGERGEG